MSFFSFVLGRDKRPLPWSLHSSGAQQSYILRTLDAVSDRVGGHKIDGLVITKCYTLLFRRSMFRLCLSLCSGTDSCFTHCLLNTLPLTRDDTKRGPRYIYDGYDLSTVLMCRNVLECIFARCDALSTSRVGPRPSTSPGTRPTTLPRGLRAHGFPEEWRKDSVPQPSRSRLSIQIRSYHTAGTPTKWYA